MTADGWAAAIVRAAGNAMAGDSAAVLGLAQQLAEEDRAKQLLHDAGYGVTGTSLLISVQNALFWISEHEPDGA